MAKFSKVDPGTMPYLRWSSLQQLVMAETSKRLHLIDLQPIKKICLLLWLTPPSLQAKLKKGENGHALKVDPDTLSCFVDMLFTFF